MSDFLPPAQQPVFANPQMPDDADQYPINPVVHAIIHGLFNGAKNLVAGPGQLTQPNPYPDGSEEAQSFEDSRTHGMQDWSNNAALSMMRGGVAGGAPVAAGEVALGSGPIRHTALDMSEDARMARAADQGYTIDAYKGGQPHDWNTMPETNGRGEVIKGTENRVPKELTSIDSPNSPYAGFFSNDPAVANRFAEPFEHGAVWPAKLKFDNPLVIDANGKHAAAFQFRAIAQENGTLNEMNQFHGAFKDGSPHDGVILKNTKDEGDVYIPRTPQQVRSRFAAFDPANIKSKDLLASSAPLLAAGSVAPIFVNKDSQ